MSVLILACGLGLMCYPWISNRIYEHSVESSAAVYEKNLDRADSDKLEIMRKEARAYNREISCGGAVLTDPFTKLQVTTKDVSYYDVLNTGENGLMCFIDIPKIDVYLPVYHGTSPEVLKKGAGHLEGSSLPVGGAGTHAVLSAHTGMNSARLFSDLEDLKNGDLFFIQVLGNVLAYRVDKIAVIRPEDTSMLKVEQDRDLVSLVTCTPYGVNTHRLVVTGERTEYSEKVQNEAQQTEPPGDSRWMQAYKKAVLAGMAVVFGAAVAAECMRVIKNRKKSNKRHGKNTA